MNLNCFATVCFVLLLLQLPVWTSMVMHITPRPWNPWVSDVWEIICPALYHLESEITSLVSYRVLILVFFASLILIFH